MLVHGVSWTLQGGCFRTVGTIPEANGSHLKMDGWETSLSFWEHLFSGAMLISGSVYFKGKHLGRGSNLTSAFFVEKDGFIHQRNMCLQ